MNKLLYTLLPVLLGMALAAVGSLLATQRLEGRAVAFQRNNPLTAGLYLLLPVSFGTVALLQQDRLPQMMILQLLLGLFFVAVLAVIDLKSMMIPNKILLAMLGVWAGIKLVWIAGDLVGGLQSMLGDISGGIFALLVFGLVYLVTRRQLGGGDVKLATLLGLYLSQQRIVGGILYGVLACALFSALLLLRKKITSKDSLPLAPFLALGYLISSLIRL